MAYPDRGNYPLASFTDTEGDERDFIPSVVALVDGRLVCGFAALDAAHAGAPLLRSLKRVLAEPGVTPATTVRLGGQELPVLEVLTAFLAHVREQLLAHPDRHADEPVEAVVGVPAHAHGAQRFVTIEAFRRAGFGVLGLVNEPSAASFEYTHRRPRSITSRRTQVVVYDLGGGTFDASLVDVDDVRHEVVASLGVNRLGGDDFDEVLAHLALGAAGVGQNALTADGYQLLLDDAREAKERIQPQSKRIGLEIDGDPVTIRVDDFYEAAAPLVQRTLTAMAPLVRGDEEAAGLAGVYIVGGGSGLPLVARMLRERFGRRVHRSPYPGGSTAIGLAIAADPASDYTLADRLSRGFGVFRELDAGARLSFDPILDRDTALAAGGTVEVVRRYRAAHNLGRYLFVEYEALSPDGTPQGDLTPFADVAFPFAAGLRGRPLEGVEVVRTDAGPEIEERYTIDAHGIVSVVLTDLTDGFSRTFALTAG